MAARYYAKKHGEEDFDKVHDIESIVVFLKTREEGELFIEDVSGVKVKFNTNTGKIKLMSVEEIKVNNFFSPYVSRVMTQPIEEAMLLLAKLDLLLQLADLPDENIAKVVRKNHVDAKSGKYINVNHAMLDKTIMQILSHASPNVSFFRLGAQENKTNLQQAIYEVLTDIDYMRLKSKEAVAEVMEKINLALHKLDTKKVTP